jgi:hypothetical protein
VARVLSSNDGTDNDDKPPPPEGTVAPMKHYWLESVARNRRVL